MDHAGLRSCGVHRYSACMPPSAGRRTAKCRSPHGRGASTTTTCDVCADNPFELLLVCKGRRCADWTHDWLAGTPEIRIHDRHVSGGLEFGCSFIPQNDWCEPRFRRQRCHWAPADPGDQAGEVAAEYPLSVAPEPPSEWRVSARAGVAQSPICSPSYRPRSLERQDIPCGDWSASTSRETEGSRGNPSSTISTTSTVGSFQAQVAAILDDGWVWHPLGVPTVIDVAAWLSGHVHARGGRHGTVGYSPMPGTNPWHGSTRTSSRSRESGTTTSRCLPVCSYSTCQRAASDAFAGPSGRSGPRRRAL